MSLTQREGTFLTCKQKSCCYATLVAVTGRDVWRISRALGTDPWTFLIYFSSPQPTPDSFMLDRSGRLFRLALAKGKTLRKKQHPPCIFLLKTRDGDHRCGLGELRPHSCQTFPLEMAGGVVTVSKEAGCVCRTWSLADVDVAEEKPRLKARRDEYDEYCRLVDEWNSRVMGLSDEEAVDFYQFCRYIMRAYNHLDVEPVVAAQP